MLYYTFLFQHICSKWSRSSFAINFLPRAQLTGWQKLWALWTSISLPDPALMQMSMCRKHGHQFYDRQLAGSESIPNVITRFKMALPCQPVGSFQESKHTVLALLLNSVGIIQVQHAFKKNSPHRPLLACLFYSSIIRKYLRFSYICGGLENRANSFIFW